MKRILVTVDFSPHTIHVCNYALNLAQKFNSEIVLFHTITRRYYMTSPGISDSFELNTYIDSDKESEKLVQKEMLELREILLSKSKGITIKEHITSGDFEDDLNEFCSEYLPSLIVVGSKGKGETLSLFGSLAIRVFNRSSFPVLVVPANENLKQPENIMFIADSISNNSLLIRKTYNLLDLYQPNIYCVNLVEDGNHLKAFAIKEELSNNFADEISKGKFYYDILESYEKQIEIDTFIEKHNIDSIAFMPHKANFFQRLIGKESSRKYVFETNLPIFAIRP